MSASAIVSVSGAPTSEAVARAAAEMLGAEPVLQQYWGSAAGVWTLTVPDGSVSVHQTQDNDAGMPPVWIDVYRPGDEVELQRLAARLFEYLAASTPWCVVLDVDGLPERTAGC